MLNLQGVLELRSGENLITVKGDSTSLRFNCADWDSFRNAYRTSKKLGVSVKGIKRKSLQLSQRTEIAVAGEVKCYIYRGRIGGYSLSTLCRFVIILIGR